MMVTVGGVVVLMVYKITEYSSIHWKECFSISSICQILRSLPGFTISSSLALAGILRSTYRRSGRRMHKGQFGLNKGKEVRPNSSNYDSYR